MAASIDPTLTKDEELLKANAEYWQVDVDYYEHLINYLRFGWEPGSFFTAILANDCLGAFTKSHPMNRMENLKALAKWILNTFPQPAFGNYAKVDAWTKLTNDERRAHLESRGLVKSAWELLQTA
jgi:hypothetical protein